MENISCNLCGSNRANLLIIKHGYRILRCSVCELVYINPRPNPSELNEIYSSCERPLQGANAPEQRANIKKFNEAIKLLESNIPTPGYLLDVGCSTGIFLQLAKAKGWRVAGIDVGETVVKYAQQQGLEVTCGELYHGLYPPETFDAVTLFDSIEHMVSPRQTLELVWEITKPGGFLLVTTPNINGFVARTTYLLFGKTIGAWEHPTPPFHLYQFSDRTLSRMLNLTGWKVVEIKKRPIPFKYTAGKLENALVEAIKNENNSNSSSVARYSNHVSSEKLQLHTQRSSKLKHLARLSVRGFSYTFLGILFSFAMLTQRFDSLMVLAQKDNS